MTGIGCCVEVALEMPFKLIHLGRVEIPVGNDVVSE